MSTWVMITMCNWALFQGFLCNDQNTEKYKQNEALIFYILSTYFIMSFHTFYEVITIIPSFPHTRHIKERNRYIFFTASRLHTNCNLSSKPL